MDGPLRFRLGAVLSLAGRQTVGDGVRQTCLAYSNFRAPIESRSKIVKSTLHEDDCHWGEVILGQSELNFEFLMPD